MARSRRRADRTFGHAHQGEDLHGAERVAGKPFVRRGSRIGGGVGRDDVLLGEPRKPALQHAEPVVLGGDPERFTIGLAVLPEVPLVAFQNRPRDAGNAGEGSFLAPVGEPAQRVARAHERAGREVAHGEPFEIGVLAAQEIIGRRVGGGLTLGGGGPAAGASPVAVLAHSCGVAVAFFASHGVTIRRGKMVASRCANSQGRKVGGKALDQAALELDGPSSQGGARWRFSPSRFGS